MTERERLEKVRLELEQQLAKINSMIGDIADSDFVKGVKDVFEDRVGIVKDNIEKVKNVRDGVVDGVADGVKKVMGVRDGVVDGVADGVKKVRNMRDDLIDGFADEIKNHNYLKNGVSKVADKVREFFGTDEREKKSNGLQKELDGGGNYTKERGLMDSNGYTRTLNRFKKPINEGDFTREAEEEYNRSKKRYTK